MAQWRSTRYNDYVPVDGATGPLIQLSANTSRVTRPIQLRDYTQIAQASHDFIGYAGVDIDQLGRKYISRITPQPYAGLRAFGGNLWLYAQAFARVDGVTLHPLGNVLDVDLGNGISIPGTPRYEQARIQVLYESLTYDVMEDTDLRMQFEPYVPTDSGETPQPNPLAGLPDEATLNRYVTILPKPFSRTISIPRALPQWVLEEGDEGYVAPRDTNAGTPVFEGLGLPESGIMLEITHHELPRAALPLLAILEAMGTINKYPLITPIGTMPKETLLYEPPDIRPETNAVGLRTYQVTHRFRLMPRYSRSDSITPRIARGFNWFLKFIRRAIGDPILDYRLLTTNGKSTGEKVFRLYDMATLFRPPA